LHFDKHWQVDGKHAFLGASKHHWINYDIEKLRRTWENQFSSQRGTELHKWAAMTIGLKMRMPKDGNSSINHYINDAIGFRMHPEVVLHYSENCFGTADAISFENGILRIHDLKTGVHPGHFNQLLIYAALFFLEYGEKLKIRPDDVDMIFRIYQGDVPYIEAIGDPKIVKKIMRMIQEYDPIIEEMKEVLL
jgi:hypothetical protein